MKSIQLIIAILFSIGIFSGLEAQVKNDAALKKGIYYIVNANGLALEPIHESVRSNVFLKKFTKSGMQKWEVIPQKDGSYLFKFYESEFYLEPYPPNRDHTPYIDEKSSFTLQKVSDSSTQWNIKSKTLRGDAMRSYHDYFDEIRFEPLENDKKFKWEFISAE
ncbi:hypothetical protein [Moheibacter sediminis]|uniref:Ricin B lectin domain-containing protein n=1 Tax=Moheibacter sediminis TaxID=1434700 RepID=A0A1W2AVF9_9FLAO|nr:hypothetical protein [Moheibacter sediminis]SMC64604.1 hypothetical protein SAMN06296427_105100 [Moheibacter sediminis]